MAQSGVKRLMNAAMRRVHEIGEMREAKKRAEEGARQLAQNNAVYKVRAKLGPEMANMSGYTAGNGGKVQRTHPELFAEELAKVKKERKKAIGY